MSSDDIAAEKRLAPTTLASTGYPLVGLTSAQDGAWSARWWNHVSGRAFDRQWSSSVRVVGSDYGFTSPTLPALYDEKLERTTSVSDIAGQEKLAMHRVGIVGLGSVGGNHWPGDR